MILHNVGSDMPFYESLFKDTDKCVSAWTEVASTNGGENKKVKSYKKSFPISSNSSNSNQNETAEVTATVHDKGINISGNDLRQNIMAAFELMQKSPNLELDESSFSDEYKKELKKIYCDESLLKREDKELFSKKFKCNLWTSQETKTLSSSGSSGSIGGVVGTQQVYTDFAKKNKINKELECLNNLVEHLFLKGKLSDLDMQTLFDRDKIEGKKEFLKGLYSKDSFTDPNSRILLGDYVCSILSQADPDTSDCASSTEDVSAGYSTRGDGNNCLIHAIIQGILKHDTTTEEDVELAKNIRSKLVEQEELRVSSEGQIRYTKPIIEFIVGEVEESEGTKTSARNFNFKFIDSRPQVCSLMEGRVPLVDEIKVDKVSKEGVTNITINYQGSGESGHFTYGGTTVAKDLSLEPKLR